MNRPAWHGSLYEPTAVGRDLWPVLIALGRWAERWMDVTPEHADPDVAAWSWCTEFLRGICSSIRGSSSASTTCFLVADQGLSDADRRTRGRTVPCRPRFGDDLVVTITDPFAFARWHIGLVD